MNKKHGVGRNRRDLEPELLVVVVLATGREQVLVLEALLESGDCR